MPARGLIAKPGARKTRRGCTGVSSGLARRWHENCVGDKGVGEGYFLQCADLDGLMRGFLHQSAGVEYIWRQGWLVVVATELSEANESDKAHWGGGGIAWKCSRLVAKIMLLQGFLCRIEYRAKWQLSRQEVAESRSDFSKISCFVPFLWMNLCETAAWRTKGRGGCLK